MRLSSCTHAALAAAALLSVASAVAEAQSTRTSSPACIALVLPSVQGVEGNATSVATAVRDSFASFLTGPSLKTMSLEARLPSQAALEARDKGCGQVLIASVTRKRSGGNKTGSILGRAAGIAVTRTPGVSGAIATGAVVAGGEALYNFAAETRKKDEIELAYRVGPPATVESARPVSSKATARTDGEDLLTPLVEKAANAVVSGATAGER